MKRRRTRGRKLLVATAGLATITYVACKKDPPVGNLPAPMPEPTEMPVGNLPAPMPDPMPEPTETAVPEPSASASAVATIAQPPQDLPPEPERPVGNLPAPMPTPKAPAPKK